MITLSKLHFVGVAPDQYWSALRVWGAPDVVHERATWSAMGDVPANDKVIFGKKAFILPDKIRHKLKAHRKELLR